MPYRGLSVMEKNNSDEASNEANVLLTRKNELARLAGFSWWKHSSFPPFSLLHSIVTLLGFTIIILVKSV